MKFWLLFSFGLTMAMAQAQEKVTSIVTDNSNSFKYFSTYNGKSHLIEIYPNHDVLIYEWLGQEVGAAKSIRNLPGIGLFKNLHIGERAVLYESNDKNYYYDFISDSPPEEISISSLNLGAGSLPLPGVGSQILGGGQPYHLFTSLSPTLIPLPSGYNYVQNYHQYLIIYKMAENGQGNNYYCYNALTGEYTLIIEGVTRKHNPFFFNDQLWYLDKTGEVMVMDLKNKNITPAHIATDLKNGGNSLFIEGSTLLICQTNAEKTYLEAIDLFNGVRLWETAVNLVGGVDKNQIALYQNYVLLRTSRDKIITLDILNQFLLYEFEISASFSQTGIPIFGPYLIVPFHDEFTFLDLRTQKVHKQNVGFTLNQLRSMVGINHNFELTLSCNFIDKKLPSLFSYKSDSLGVKNIDAYNTGCSTNAFLLANDEQLYLVDHSLFAIADQEERLTNTSFRQGENRYINFSKNNHYYLKQTGSYIYLLTHDGIKEDTLYISAGIPKKYEFITRLADHYFVFADEKLYRLDPADNTLTLLKTAIRYVYEDGSQLYFKLENHLGLLDDQGNIHEYDVMPNSMLPHEFISQNGILVMGSNWNEIIVVKDEKKLRTIEDVFIITRMVAVKNHIFVTYISTPDFQEKRFSVDALGQVTQLDAPGINYFTEQHRQCQDFLILQAEGQTNFVFDPNKNTVAPLSGEIDRKNCLYLYQNGTDTLAYILEDNTLNIYQMSRQFSEQILIRSLPFEYVTDRLRVYEIPGHVVMMGLTEMIIFDSNGRASKLPLNTYLLENNPLVEWQNNYYCMASDATAVRQVYKIDFENLTTSTTPLSEIKEVFIYPNPASSLLRLSGWEDAHTIEIYNTAGTCVLKAMAEPEIRIDQLPNDIYYLKVVNLRGNKTVLPFIKAD
jgi:hypothetical protein